jgi:hypothetical protein
MSGTRCIQYLAAPLLLLLLGLTGCTSVQWIDATGQPRALGLAWIDPQTTGVTRVVAPGLSLSLVPSLYGYAAGWRETLIFQAARPDRPPRLAALAYRMYGVQVDGLSLVVGSDESLAVMRPDDDDSFMQSISYSATGPLRGSIECEEIR